MKIKLKATTYALLMILSLSNALKAEELALPIITRPSSLDEGTQTKLSSAQVTEIAPWARDSKVFLNDLLEGSVNLTTFDKHERLVNGIKFVVGESSPKNNEIFMRYILNRSLVLDAILEKEMDPNEAGTIDVKLGLLLSSIKMAQRYFDCDMSMMTKNDSAQFADFGKDYFKYLIKLNKSVFDASAEYAVEKTALEWLQWDLYRDLNNKLYAPAIIKINNALRNFTDKKMSDRQSIAIIREMKGLIAKLDLSATSKKIDSIVLTVTKTEMSPAPKPERAGSSYVVNWELGTYMFFTNCGIIHEDAFLGDKSLVKVMSFEKKSNQYWDDLVQIEVINNTKASITRAIEGCVGYFPLKFLKSL